MFIYLFVRYDLLNIPARFAKIGSEEVGTLRNKSLSTPTIAVHMTST
jgi:hypothetical protein